MMCAIYFQLSSKLHDWLLDRLARRTRPALTTSADHSAQADISFTFFYFILIGVGASLKSEQLNVENSKWIISPWPWITSVWHVIAIAEISEKRGIQQCAWFLIWRNLMQRLLPLLISFQVFKELWKNLCCNALAACDVALLMSQRSQSSLKNTSSGTPGFIMGQG